MSRMTPGEKRRPPRLHPGPLPTRPPDTVDPEIVVFTFTMTGREVVTITTSRESRDAMSERISEAIATGKTLTLHDSDGSQTIVNTAHVVLVSVR